ncbi:MAG: hypothetical protein AAF587_06590 [Bacteroidota bacterium]
MNRIISTILLFLLGGGFLLAQPSKVTSGVLAQQGGNNEEAIEKLEAAIADKSLFVKGKAKHLPKAYYSLYKAYFAVAADTSMNVPDALTKAKDYYTMAINDPGYGDKYQKQSVLENATGNLWGAFYNKGITDFNLENDASALTSFQNADELKPDHILTQRMLGAIYISTQDSMNGVKSLEKAINLFKAKYIDADEASIKAVKEAPDYEVDSSQISYMYQQLAVLYNSGYGSVEPDARKALDLLSDGMNVDPNDQDLKRQELNVYQQNPALFAESKKKFEEAINANQGDLQIKLAYANLLDRNGDLDDAFQYYKEVNESDSDNIGGIYGVGAYYINKAAEISNAKAKYTKDAEIEAADKQILELVEKAYPYMVKLHELQPNEREWLSQLINITPMIGKDQEMEMYYEKMKKLDGSK